jgi:hypothetical protein
MLVSFLAREAADFKWKSLDSKVEYLRRMDEEIEEKLSEIDAGNFVHVVSLTNLGLVTRELVLTPTPWCPDRVVKLLLPSTPRGGIGVSVEEK